VAQGAGGERVGAGGAAEAEVDPARVERGERAELLGDHERRVVRQHHAARAHADPLGVRRDVADQHRRRRACDAGHAVVLGEPEAAVAVAFGVLGELARGRQRLGRGRAGADRRQIEDRERNHRPRP
jgi:hypothetical protein